MPKQPKGLAHISRELVWTKTDFFLGWGCNQCGWRHQIPREPASEQSPSEEATEAFARHKCAIFSRR
jgi:hypothetical protein